MISRTLKQLIIMLIISRTLVLKLRTSASLDRATGAFLAGQNTSSHCEISPCSGTAYGLIAIVLKQELLLIACDAPEPHITMLSSSLRGTRTQLYESASLKLY